MPNNNAFSSSAEWQRLREIIREKSLRKDKEYTLSSGERSGYYFDMKPTTFNPEALNLLCPILYELVSSDRGVYVGGLAVGAIPIISALVHYSASRNGIMGFYVREEIKNHGTQNLVEGFLENGANVIMFDDVTTSGASVMKAVQAVRDRNCRVIKVITIVDRLEGACERFKREGLDFVPIFTTKDFAS
jgi:orotate phosphoribosyltransferase